MENALTDNFRSDAGGAAVKAVDMTAVADDNVATGDLSRDWPNALYKVLREADVRQAFYVPAAGHTSLIGEPGCAKAIQIMLQVT